MDCIVRVVLALDPRVPEEDLPIDSDGTELMVGVWSENYILY